MYLSRLQLDPANRQVMAEIANRYELHRTLLSQFKSMDRNEIGLLHRIEPIEKDVYQPIILLVQTQIEPSWEGLSKRGLLTRPVEIKTFEGFFETGKQFYFRLLANPTVRKAKGDWAGKRVELRTPEEISSWLRRKGESGGFKILNMQFSNLGKITSVKSEAGKKQTIQHQAVLYEGVLEVGEAEKFKATLEKGVGSAKGFGFGLLSLAR